MSRGLSELRAGWGPWEEVTVPPTPRVNHSRIHSWEQVPAPTQASLEVPDSVTSSSLWARALLETPAHQAGIVRTRKPCCTCLGWGGALARRLAQVLHLAGGGEGPASEACPGVGTGQRG